MRVLHVLDHSIPLHSGYAFRTRAILRHQRALGWETFHLTSPKHYLPAPGRETVDGLEFFRTAQPWRGWSRLPGLGEVALMAALARRLKAVALDVKPDVLHVHSPVLNALPALWVGARMKLPVLYELRAFWEDGAVSHGTMSPEGTRYKLSRWLETFAARHADALVTICRGMRQELIERGLPSAKIGVARNGVDMAAFGQNQVRDEALAATLGLDGKTVLGFIGSFYGYEGLDLLLEAVASLRRDGDPGIRVLLVGGGPEEERLKALAGRLRIADQVVFAGRVEHEAVKGYYGLVDIMVYPRIANRVTELVTPLKPLEALAQRKIVMASDVGGHRELLGQSGVSRFFRAGDAQALAACVRQALSEQEAWPEQAAKGRRFVEEQSTWERSLSSYEEIYGGLLSRSPAPEARDWAKAPLEIGTRPRRTD